MRLVDYAIGWLVDVRLNHCAIVWLCAWLDVCLVRCAIGELFAWLDVRLVICAFGCL